VRPRRRRPLPAHRRALPAHRRARPKRLRLGAVAAVAALAGIAAACDSPTIPERPDGYGFALPGPDLVFHWASGTRVRVFVASEPASRAQGLADAFTAAARAWTVAAPLGEIVVERASSIATADVVVAWSDGPFPVATQDCTPSTGAAGVTTFCLTPDNGAFVRFPAADGGASDVIFLITISPAIAEDAVVRRRLVTHEIGHALGLFQHSPNAADLMFGGQLSVDAPSEADRATFYALYHTPSDLTP
jgi:predicted Zn-dependent protease